MLEAELIPPPRVDSRRKHLVALTGNLNIIVMVAARARIGTPSRRHNKIIMVQHNKIIAVQRNSIRIVLHN
jgi:hypothetical protein